MWTTVCGNYNGSNTDDLVMPDGTLVTNFDDFATSWATGNMSNCGTLTPAPFCLGVTSIGAQSRCNNLLGNIFESCREAIDPSQFSDNCIFDYCNCNEEDREECYCESLKTYSSACSTVGAVIPDWVENFCRK